MLRNIILLFPIVISTALGNENKTINREEKEVTVCESPVQIYHPSHIEGNPYFLNYGDSYPNSYLTVVIWERDISNLEINPYTYFSTGAFCIRGDIERFNQRDQITLRSPDQIILNKNSNRIK